jgi:hypothetical protein
MTDIQQQIDILTRSLEILDLADLCGCPPTFSEMQEILNGLEIHARWARMHVQGRLEQTEEEAKRRGIPMAAALQEATGTAFTCPIRGKPDHRLTNRPPTRTTTEGIDICQTPPTSTAWKPRSKS